MAEMWTTDEVTPDEAVVLAAWLKRLPKTPRERLERHAASARQCARDIRTGPRTRGNGRSPVVPPALLQARRVEIERALAFAKDCDARAREVDVVGAMPDASRCTESPDDCSMVCIYPACCQLEVA